MSRVQRRYPVASPFSPPPGFRRRSGQALPWTLSLWALAGLFMMSICVVLVVVCYRGKEPAHTASIPWQEPPAPEFTPPPRAERPLPAAPVPQPEVGEKSKPPAEETNSSKKVVPVATPKLEPAQEKKITAGPLVLPPPSKLNFRIHFPPALALEERKLLRLAVTTPEFDDMGRLLEQLGDGYNFTTINEDHLRDLKRLTPFHVVFLTCGTSNSQDLRVISSLRRFVELGGTLYASDLRYDLLARAFPEHALKKPMQRGQPQTIEARVVDTGLGQLLGPQISLDFKAPGWRPAAFNRNLVQTYLEGSYRGEFGPMFETPLLVKFKCQKGFVIFTSFHNAAQNNEVQKKLLQYLVFTTVNARTEALAQKAMLSHGFMAKETKNLTIAAENSPAKFTYALGKNGSLQFAVAFANQGARLRLEIEAPGGQKIEHADNTSFILEVADAPAGTWRFSITGVSIAHANFPFTLIVGDKK